MLLRSKFKKSDEDTIISGSTMEQPTSNILSFDNENHVESNLAEEPVPELNIKLSDGASTFSNQSDKVQYQSQKLSSGGMDSANLESISKGSKTSANSDEFDEKAKCPVVQQKGRFKVTSENVEMEKVVPAPLILQKSQSLQVIAQHPALSSPLPSDATPSNPLGHAFFPTLQSVLQKNIIQRDCILSLMKQVAVGDCTDMECMPMNETVPEKSLLEAAHDREKELLCEITDLQQRLLCAQEELQKNKVENAQLV